MAMPGLDDLARWLGGAAPDERRRRIARRAELERRLRQAQLARRFRHRVADATLPDDRWS